MVQDKWSEWLLRKRFGGDAQAAEEQMRMLHRVRDLVLDNAELHAGHTALDVGAGDGLIAFGALDRVGESGRVIFADISQPLLDHARALAEEMGVAERCSFLNASADALTGISDESVDLVTTRSVLIYVKDKRAAFREFHRVLRPGGRLSIWEPINRFTATYEPGQFWGADIEGIEDLAQRLGDFYRKLQPMDTDPMGDFDERDLLRHCEGAGFHYVRVDLSVYAAPIKPAQWDRIINVPGNPNIPSFAEAMQQIFSEDERRRYAEALRPRIEAGSRVQRLAVAHLVAVKDGGAEQPDLTRRA